MFLRYCKVCAGRATGGFACHICDQVLVQIEVELTAGTNAVAADRVAAPAGHAPAPRLGGSGANLLRSAHVHSSGPAALRRGVLPGGGEGVSQAAGRQLLLAPAPPIRPAHPPQRYHLRNIRGDFDRPRLIVICEDHLWLIVDLQSKLQHESD